MADNHNVHPYMYIEGTTRGCLYDIDERCMGELLHAQYSHAGTGIEGTEMILSNRAIRQHTNAAYGGMVVVGCIYLYMW